MTTTNPAATHNNNSISNFAIETLRRFGFLVSSRDANGAARVYRRINTEAGVDVYASINNGGKAWTLVLVSEAYGHETLLHGAPAHCDHALAHTLEAICDHFALTTF